MTYHMSDGVCRTCGRRGCEGGPACEVAAERRADLPLSSTHMDEVGFIMDFESGNVTEEQIIEGFQMLIDNGHAWTLQGSYGRMAQALIERGLCHG